MKIKKLAALITAGCLAFGLTACGGGDSEASSSASAAASSAASETSAAAEETKEESTKEETKEESSAPAEAASAETVKVGVLLPLSGATSYYGGVQLNGLEFCVDYVNRNGGIKSLGGAQVELVIQDSASSPETGISAFESLVDDGEISAIIGPYNSTVAAATAPLAIQHEVPYVIINATAENFMGEPNKWVYRTNTGSGDGDMIYALAIEHLNNVRPDNPTDKVAIVYDSGDWGTAASATWTSTAEEMGYEVVLNEAVSESSTDLSTIVNKMKSEDVDVCILAAFSAATNLLVKQMYEYGCDTKVMSIGGGVGDIEFIENTGDAANGVLYLTSWLPKFGGGSDETQALAEEFKETYGYDMTMEPCWGWLGMATIINAIEAAGSTDREAIADALYEYDVDADDWSCMFVDFEGCKFGTDGEESDRFATGVRYNNNIESGERDGMVLAQVQDGKFVVVYPVGDYETIY